MDKKNYIVLAIAIIAVAGLTVYFPKDASKFQANVGNLTAQKDNFSTDISGLPDAKTSETVELKNGDSYDLAVSAVKKKIGESEVRMLAYNGSVPGPILKIEQGAEVAINLANNTNLDTTLHMHGVRMENSFDGVPDVTQRPVKKGETFSYKVKFDDPGAFWYHPHIRSDYTVESGLYGSIVVAPKDKNYWPKANREVALMIDDILMKDGNTAPFSLSSINYALMGRFGNVMLVNGEVNPNLNFKQGEVVRFYLTDVANTRTFNLSVPGVKMKLIGKDGGKYEKESFVDSAMLSPGERAVVDFLFEKSGNFELIHKTPSSKYILGSFTVLSEKVGESFAGEFNALRKNADVISEMQEYKAWPDKTPGKYLSLSLSMRGVSDMSSMSHGMGGGSHMMPDGTMMSNDMMDPPKPTEWEDDMSVMNKESIGSSITWQIVDRATGKKNMDIDWKFKAGEKVKIRIFNDPNSMHPMQHPIHFHGQRFLVLQRDGVANGNLVWEDTALVKSGETIDILLDAASLGEWMAHCHILEHAESGMMFSFKVE